MGLFDSSTTFTAYAGSSPLIDPEERKHTIKTMMLQSLYTNKNITDAFLMGYNTDMTARAKSMTRYAERPNGYYYGLPEATHGGDDKYLPIAVLMHDTAWFDEADESTDEDPLELTTKRLLKRLAMDAYEVKEEYIANVEEAIASGDRPGPGVLDEYDFFILFSVPMHSNIRGSKEYIYHFLKFLPTVNQWTSRSNYEAYLAGGQVGDQPSSNFHLSEGEGSSKDWQVTATGYEIYYAWSYIEHKYVNGRYTPPGWIEPLKTGHTYANVVEFGDADYSEGIQEFHGSNAAIATSEPEGAYHDYAMFTHQYYDGETDSYYYGQVIIMAPTQMFVINTPSEGENAEIQYIDSPLFPEDPEEESEFRWPVHYNVMKEVRLMHREEMLQDALTGTVFLVHEEQKKWYQQGFFKWLIIIVTIVVVVLAWHFHLLPTIASLAASATSAAVSTSLWALYVVLTFAIGYLISFSGNLIGGDLGAIFSMVAAFMAAGGSFSGFNPFSKISGAWANLTTAPSFGSALQFIQAVEPAIKIGLDFYFENEMKELELEMEDFLKSQKDRYEQLEEMWDQFGGSGGSSIDPLEISRALTMSNGYENPNSFYNRSLTANPGVLGYELIEKFTELAIMLPKNPGEEEFIQQMFNTMAKQRGQA